MGGFWKDKHQFAFNLDLQIDPLWCAWFSGLVDGEGHLQLQHRPERIMKSVLRISMRNDDDDLIRDIHKTLHCGNVYTRKEYMDTRGYYSAEQTCWMVSKMGDIINIVIPIFDQYPLRSKKYYEYVLWREAALIIRSREHFKNDSIFGHLLDLKKKMESGRKRERPEYAIHIAKKKNSDIFG